MAKDTVYEVNNFQDANIAADKLFDYLDGTENLSLSIDPQWIYAMLVTEDNIVSFYTKAVEEEKDDPDYDEIMRHLKEAKNEVDKGLDKIDRNNFTEASYRVEQAFFFSILKVMEFFKD